MEKNIERNTRKNERPTFPKRAVITAGMPYGNKELHFGHIGGVFVHADTLARFLRDRIGKENVIFVSGTDCYGSPILESYRKITEDNSYSGTIEDYVKENHLKQKDALDKYEISLNLFAGSALDRAGEIHSEVSKEVFEKLYDNGYLTKMSNPQFYDEEFNVFLNGRQVIGKCPIQGCSSEKAYADECSLGHQYMPSELIDPISALSGKKPVVKDVTNWYFKLDKCNDLLKERVDYLRQTKKASKYLLNTVEEFLKEPVIYVQKKNIEDLDALEAELPEHSTINEEKKPSVTFVFKDLEHRDEARVMLGNKGINFRTGKTLVPFRLSGNVDWGVKVPDKEDLNDLTFWVWPESLWAPISFTKAYLEKQGFGDEEWKKWWNNDEAEVYQFIGEDNIYFYGIAEMGLFTALLNSIDEKPDMSKIQLPNIIANNHILFMGKKASSSSEIKPPMARELLDYYTAEQLRIHFLSLGLSTKSASFQPQAFMEEDKREGVDTVLKEGNLLTNVFNRLVRSCFYTSQKYFDGVIPQGEVSEEILKEAHEAILTYEKHMYKHEFHSITYVLDSYIRNMNKYWVNNIKQAEAENNNELRKKILIDSFHAVRTVTALIHPIAPEGAEMVREYLGANEDIWNWEYIFEPIYSFIGNKEVHKLKFLEPKVDFFKKHESQFK
ncbi:methionine--tRNA ligase [Inconstantimicrobium mannanitabidum]|uniref:Uncharacterized protein n=1 Tax=Inconstantimicrobium mannanitabidum TaxID=1604901 RepID=A0ACB5RFR4_9CLOT|nr:class I tRNA ligase family protein [Clostridium sp. TW13]GKX67935.1 hypothetical protein rsdtw13_31930 [Clostridium sp. TW13]